MTAPQHLDPPTRHIIQLSEPNNFELWRDQARALVQCDIPPKRILWLEPGAAADLFASAEGEAAGMRTPVPPTDGPVVRASKSFVQLAKSAICHSDPGRFDLLYRLLWRYQSNPRVLEDRADPDVRRLDELARQVRRDMHKMRAFVRFRRVGDPGHSRVEEGFPEEGDAGERYVAWFEPEHHILRANAGFFVRRFANMRWSILTPEGSLNWDGDVLAEGPPAQRSDAPDGDPTEDLWRRYYASIFNPARLKVGAMLKEMPRKYWKNLPEAELIPELVAGAQARESAMVSAGAVDASEQPDTLEAIDKAIHACRRCPIGELDNRAVMGEGPRQAALMIVGEQPGDQEDLQGRPFVGPAGQVLDAHLERAGIRRSDTYVTNAVKHFKFVQRGKRRLHQTPTAREVDICRWWNESERAIVRPKIVLALGASAARGLLGKTVSISKARGVPHPLEDGSELWITAHPSYLLRLDGSAREEQDRMFHADLVAVAERLAELTE